MSSSVKVLRRRGPGKHRTGAVAVEFALTAPLLFLMLFGSLELAHANMLFNVSEAAAYEGARQGIVPGATAADCEAAVNRLLQISKIRGATVRVTPQDLTTESEQVDVAVSVPYAANSMVATLFTQGMIIERSCSLTREKL